MTNHPIKPKMLRAGISTQFFKTKMCAHYLKGDGGCTQAEKCRFAHNADELRPLPNLKKTKLCEFVLRGLKCTVEGCSFAHSRSELRTSHSTFYKASLCTFHRKGRCLNGEYCRFAHGPEDIRASESADFDDSPEEFASLPVVTVAKSSTAERRRSSDRQQRKKSQPSTSEAPDVKVEGPNVHRPPRKDKGKMPQYHPRRVLLSDNSPNRGFLERPAECSSAPVVVQEEEVESMQSQYHPRRVLPSTNRGFLERHAERSATAAVAKEEEVESVQSQKYTAPQDKEKTPSKPVETRAESSVIPLHPSKHQDSSQSTHVPDHPPTVERKRTRCMTAPTRVSSSSKTLNCSSMGSGYLGSQEQDMSQTYTSEDGSDVEYLPYGSASSLVDGCHKGLDSSTLFPWDGCSELMLDPNCTVNNAVTALPVIKQHSQQQNIEHQFSANAIPFYPASILPVQPITTSETDLHNGNQNSQPSYPLVGTTALAQPRKTKSNHQKRTRQKIPTLERRQSNEGAEEYLANVQATRIDAFRPNDAVLYPSTRPTRGSHAHPPPFPSTEWSDNDCGKNALTATGPPPNRRSLASGLTTHDDNSTTAPTSASSCGNLLSSNEEQSMHYLEPSIVSADVEFSDDDVSFCTRYNPDMFKSPSRAGSSGDQFASRPEINPNNLTLPIPTAWDPRDAPGSHPSGTCPRQGIAFCSSPLQLVTSPLFMVQRQNGSNTWSVSSPVPFTVPQPTTYDLVAGLPAGVLSSPHDLVAGIMTPVTPASGGTFDGAADATHSMRQVAWGFPPHENNSQLSFAKFPTRTERSFSRRGFRAFPLPIPACGQQPKHSADKEGVAMNCGITTKEPTVENTQATFDNYLCVDVAPHVKYLE